MSKITAEHLARGAIIYIRLSNRFQFRPPFRFQSRPLFGRCLELIHVMHRRDPRP